MSTRYRDINEAIKETLQGGQKRESLNEAFVARPKKFDLATEKISVKTKTAHTELYQGYVESYNRISAELDTISREEVNSNNSIFRDLKIDEVNSLNAAYLHELYFANISDLDSEITVDSLSYMRLTRDFGTFDDWQRDFIACAMSARNGWAMTVFNTYLQAYVNVVVDLHTCHIPVGAYPVIVLDCWEHAYFGDRQNDRKKYVNGMLGELNWEIIENRFKRAERIAQALR